MKKKLLLSSAVLLLFLIGMGREAFFPSLRPLADSFRAIGILPGQWLDKGRAVLLLGLAFIGFMGWTSGIQRIFFRDKGGSLGSPLSFTASLVLFSIFCWTLAVNELLYGWLVLPFFLAGWKSGWRVVRGWRFPKVPGSLLRGLLLFAGALWLFEYLSPPIIWDAVLDHFRYAREVARLHGTPLRWADHTGDMPKGFEVLLAGFWALGGESLSKLSSILPVLGMLALLRQPPPGERGEGHWTVLLFLLTPFFLAVFAWGYVEGFLGLLEFAAFLSFWRSWEEPKERTWTWAAAFFLGAAFSVKYTAALAVGSVGLGWVIGWVIRRQSPRPDGRTLLFFLLPILPWTLKNLLVFGNPFYPLATGIFGSAVGYTPGMESLLWSDTGRPASFDPLGMVRNLWGVLFTSHNQVGAAWSPLVLMGLFWPFGRSRKAPFPIVLITFLLFLAGWEIFCTSLRHLTGGILVLFWLGSWGWEAVLRDKAKGPQVLLALGLLVSLWLTLSAQASTTAPYLPALGLEDPGLRLKRNFHYSLDSFAAYRSIERSTGDKDKVLAFGVFQAYPLGRTAFVDFRWKAPIFLQWANESRTAEELAGRMRREGIEVFLYQREEAKAMAPQMGGMHWHGIPRSEYVRFWREFMEPGPSFGEVRIFRLRKTPIPMPMEGSDMPILRETAP